MDRPHWAYPVTYECTLGRLHLLAVGNKYLFDTLVSVLLGVYPEVELPELMVVLFLVF